MRRQGAVWLGAICLCEMATMLVFLNYTAVLPILQEECREIGDVHKNINYISSHPPVVAVGHVENLIFLWTSPQSRPHSHVYDFSRHDERGGNESEETREA